MNRLWNLKACGLAVKVLVLFSACLFVCPVKAASDSVWIEGEATTGVAPVTIKPVIENVGRPGYLSQGSWLHLNIEPSDVEKTVPADGILLTYRFTASRAASYNLWDRVGYEKARSPFEWRIDSGAWTTITPNTNTLDVEELQTWNPIAWLPLGAQQITEGPHTLQIRVDRSKNDKGKTAALVYASDALYLTPETFHPDGPHPPGAPAVPAQVFPLKLPSGAAQTATPLTGDWQIAAADELVVEDRLGPIKSLPDSNALSWHAIPIPSDRNSAIPEMAYVHRYFLRTRITVPADLAGHAFYLHLPGENMIATVFVNGRQCGWTKNPYAVWDCDVTSALKPGQVNDLWVGIKDAFYGLADTADIKHPQYTPFDFWHYNLTNQLDMPELSHLDTGLLRTPSLVVAGRAYTSDVFAIPSVKNKTLGLEVTVHNPTDQPITVSVGNKIVPLAGGPIEKTFAAKEATVPAGEEALVKFSEPWTTPKLWWPDSPSQYNVVTTLSLNGAAVDERTTKFGFREWGWHGPNFTLNAIPFHGRADLADYSRADEEAVALWRKHGQTMQRLWGEGKFSGLDPEAALDFYDAHGVVTRRTGIFDGEGAAGFYGLTEDVGGKTGPRRALFENWRQQLVAWAKGQRNYPSIFLWSMENEITFINSKVFGTNSITDPEIKKASDLLTALDPTRPQMTDGGNGLLDESLPVYGGHYMDPPLSSLPEGAYDKAAFTHRQIWPITQQKPFLIGETYFLSGIDLGDLATVGGESAFVGKSESHPAGGLAAKMLSEGYRWNDVSFQFWFGGETDVHYNSWQPIAVLCRQWDSTFSSGQKVSRTLGVFNDTHQDQAISLTWTLRVGGQKIAAQTSLHPVRAGKNDKFSVIVPMPIVTRRQQGTWTLALTVGGRSVFSDVRPISVLKPAFPRVPGTVAVYDPLGSAAAFLTKAGVPFRRVTSLSRAPASAKVLVVGQNALTPAQSVSTQLAAYALAGRVVIVLEQKTPLHYSAIPGTLAPDSNLGSIAFIEDAASPVLSGLDPKDFFTWGGDGVVYRNAYVKPTSGGKSLIQCSDRLQDTALAEMPAGKGLLLLSQLLIGEKLPNNAVAQQLFLNLVSYGLSYRQAFHPVTVAAGENKALSQALKATGLHYGNATSPLATLSKPGTIAVLNASPATLKILAANLSKVAAFTASGGWIIFNNLTPDGLSDYNKIVGVSHLIRPYTQEKVTWPVVRNPLTAGLATSNIVLGSGKPIFDFSSGEYPDADAFSYVVDYDDVAPFAKSSFGSWDKITNNYTMADGFWPLIINLPALPDGKPVQVPMTLPRPEKITQFTWVSDNNYQGTTKVSLLFDGKDKAAFGTQPNGEFQTLAVTPPRTAQHLTLTVDDGMHDPAHQSNGKDLIGIDNIYLKAYRSPDFYRKVKPMLNIGAFVEYPKGPGGIVLCNVKFKDTEGNPQNSVKKQTILATLLRNLNAPFSGGKTIIAGANNLTYTPLDLSKQANQYVTERGWYGDKQFTFADLPRGRQSLAGVTYSIYNFITSPVPSAVMLGGADIPGNLPDHVDGIPVGLKADALFFLQAARIDQRRNADEVKQNKVYEMADYAVHYADGQIIKVPVYAEINVDDYKQKMPAILPGAQTAWVKPCSGTDRSVVAYSMQWNNPRPNVVIQSIDLTYGPDKRGVPSLLAVTAATAAK